MSKTILLIAFDYPPCQSAGVQRTLKFSEQLPDYGWRPVVLTVSTKAHSKIDNSQLSPDAVDVYRAKCLDASRHLALKGRYLGITAVPDRYSSWILTGILKGLEIIKRYKPDVIWSTYPIPSAHLIAYALAKWSHIPWFADYRDPAPFHYTDSLPKSRMHEWIDRKTANNADFLSFATDKMRDLYLEKYSGLHSDQTCTIENGFNEEVFLKIVNEGSDFNKDRLSNNCFTLLHSGALYKDGRDPAPLFDALELLKKTEEGRKTLARLTIVFRGTPASESYLQRIKDLGIEDHIKFLPNISYVDSIKEMMAADALLLIQGPVFNYQIPGKAYEYLASNRPILGLVDSAGATAGLLNRAEGSVVVDSNNVPEIAASLVEITGFGEISRETEIYGRRSRTEMFAKYLAKIG